MIQWLGVHQCRSCGFNYWSGSLGPTCLEATKSTALMQLRPHTAKYIFFSLFFFFCGLLSMGSQSWTQLNLFFFFKKKTWMGSFENMHPWIVFVFVLHFSLTHDWKFALLLNTFLRIILPPDLEGHGPLSYRFLLWRNLIPYACIRRFLPPPPWMLLNSPFYSH